VTDGVDQKLSHDANDVHVLGRQLVGTHLEAPKTTVPEIQAAPGSPNATTIGAVLTVSQHPKGPSPCNHAGYCPMLVLLYHQTQPSLLLSSSQMQWQLSISCP
jgi:hypothetical protein